MEKKQEKEEASAKAKAEKEELKRLKAIEKEQKLKEKAEAKKKPDKKQTSLKDSIKTSDAAAIPSGEDNKPSTETGKRPEPIQSTEAILKELSSPVQESV